MTDCTDPYCTCHSEHPVCDNPIATRAGEFWTCPECGREWASVPIAQIRASALLISRGMVSPDAFGWTARSHVPGT